jgi:hypothetical protein
MITSLDQVSDYPLCWPDNKPRAAERQRSPFKTTLPKAEREIEQEMRMWRARGYVVSMSARHRVRQFDPGVALWWNQPITGKPIPELRVLACDSYQEVADNLHAIARTLEGLRAFERYGTYTREQAIEGARLALPPPTRVDGPHWSEVLGVERNWPLGAIEAVWKTKAEKAHPDRGGSLDEMARLNAAIDEARKELGR